MNINRDLQTYIHSKREDLPTAYAVSGNRSYSVNTLQMNSISALFSSSSFAEWRCQLPAAVFLWDRISQNNELNGFYNII